MDGGNLAQWASAAATTFAASVALFGDRMRRAWFRPLLRASILREEGEDAASIHTPRVLPDVSNEEHNREMQYARRLLPMRFCHIKVTNERRLSPAHDVRLYLTHVEEPGVAGQFEVRWQTELPMAARHGEQIAPRRVVGEPAVFEALSVDERGVLRIHTGWNAFAFNRERQGKSDLRLHFVARSDEAESGPLVLEVHYDGQWEPTWEGLKRHLSIRTAQAE